MLSLLNHVGVVLFVVSVIAVDVVCWTHTSHSLMLIMSDNEE